ncbi:MAG: DUF2911 domain-containing protein [Acidobacteria bacterium]|nr:DUF2911 domain-containing protein [Acidobacteriota bacterium]
MMKLAKLSAPAALMLVLAFQVGLAASGSTKVNFSKDTLVAGKNITAGDYTVRWKSSSPEAMVTFSNRQGVAAEVQAKLVERDTASYYDSVLAAPNAKGELVLKEIRFRGKKYVLVFE